MEGITVKSDKQYETENDARILVDAQLIREDSKRMEAAVKQIQKENAARKAATK